jgi:Lysozyme like domain
MTKTKLLGGVMMVTALILGLTGSASASPSTPAETVYAKSNAPIATEAFQPIVVDKAEKPNKPKKVCKNWLVRELKEAGFKGRGLRIGWAIAMRESGGRANAISSTGDYGVFQFNRAAHSDQPWWNTQKLLTRDYNIMVAYNMSQHGKTWYPWDIDGRGNHKGNYTSTGTYNVFKSWYNKYPCK